MNTGEAINWLIERAKAAREIDYKIYGLSQQRGGAPFSAGYSTSALRWGPSKLPPNIGQSLSHPTRENALATASVVSQPEEFGGIFRYVDRKPAEYGKTGFSHLVVGREKFHEVMNLVGSDPDRQLEALEMMLTYTDASLQTELVSGDVVAATRSRNISAPDYIHQQAVSMQRMLQGGPNGISQQDMMEAFVFDIETAGLDDASGIRQIGYKRKMRDKAGNILRDERGIAIMEEVEVLFDNPMMNMGAYEGKSFQEYLASLYKKAGRETPAYTSRVEGMKQFFTDIMMDDVNVMEGQNVKFDIEKILEEGRVIAEYADDEFNQLFLSARRKMLGDTSAAVVDIQKMMSLLLDHVVDPNGIGDGRALSQEAVSGFTSLLSDARKAGLLDDDTWSKLSRLGLHDAAVDVNVSGAIGVLQHAILTNQEGSENLMRQIGFRGWSDDGKPIFSHTAEELDPAIRKGLEDAGALLPTTGLPGAGNQTPLTELITGTRKLRPAVADVEDVNFYDLLYRGSRYDHKRLGTTGPSRDALEDARRRSGGRAEGFLNPEFAEKINGRKTEEFLGADVPAYAGKTVQRRLADMDAPFAYLSEPERMLGEFLNQSSLGHAASSYGADFGFNYFTAFQTKEGKVFHAFKRSVAMDPRILRATDELTGGALLQAARFGDDLDPTAGLVTRLSPVKGHSDRVVQQLHLFPTGHEAEVTEFMERISGTIKGIQDQDEEVLKALKKAGYSDEEIEAVGKAMDPEALNDLAIKLRDPSIRRYGIQTGTYEGVADAKWWIQSMIPEREEAQKANRLFGQYLPELPTGEKGIASLPIQGIEDLLQRARAGDAEALEELRYIASNSELSVALEGKLDIELRGWWRRQVADASRSSARIGGRAVGMTSTMHNFFKKTKRVMDSSRNRWIAGAAVAAGMVGLALKREDDSFDMTLVQGAYGYERSGAYSEYKAALGETPMADFATNPMVNRPPTIDTVGIVQDAHDNRTGHHNMDRTTKYAHLFGY